MKNSAFWLRLSVFNFFLVSVLGVLMRYKIAFSLPQLDQKHLQQAHSHFAFYGWISLAVYVLIVLTLKELVPTKSLKKYNAIIVINTFAALLMIPLFLWKGYFVGSIVVSTVSLLIGFVFFGYLLLDYKDIQHPTKPWFLGSLFFAMISSLGVFGLSIMFAQGKADQHFYLASTYYYLHFQYNGFFMFSCIGLLMNFLKKYGTNINLKENTMVFWLMFVGCIIGYGLSVLWLKLPLWIFVIIIIGTILQTFGAWKIVQLVRKNWDLLKVNLLPVHRFALVFSGVAFITKIILQLGSNVPFVAQFAFGFRNVVIAYLHLVLLMCISVFLVVQILNSGFFKNTKSIIYGFSGLMLGIFLNEAMLGTMGILSIKYISIPNSAEILLWISIFMMLSLAFLFASLRKN